MVVIPQTAHRGEMTLDMNKLNASAWEWIPQNSTVPQLGTIFKEKGESLEGQLINAIGLPARVVLDGKFGSFSSNQAYRETAYDTLQSRASRMMQTLNRQFIDPLLSLNYDAPGLLHIQQSPLEDDSLQNLVKMYPILKESPNVDMSAVNEKLGIPDNCKSDKFESVEAVDDEEFDPDIYYWQVPELAKKLGYKDRSIVSALRRYQPSDLLSDRPIKGTDNRYRCPHTIVEEIFGVSLNPPKQV